MQVANPNRAQFTKCARTAIPYTTNYARTEVVSGLPTPFSTFPLHIPAWNSLIAFSGKRTN